MFQKRVEMNKNMNNYYHHYYYHSCYYKNPCSSNSNKTRPGVSLLAFVLCCLFIILFYCFIFHALDVSPCDAMRDVRFLFFFSNAIVLVIVADYGAFVSSSEEENVEESYGTVAAEEGPVPYSVVVKVGGYVEDGEVTKELPVVGEGDDVLVQARSEEVKLLTYNGAGRDVEGETDGEGLRAVDEEERVLEEGEENHEFSRMSVETETDSDEDGEGLRVVDEEERVVEQGEENHEFSQMFDKTDSDEDGEGLTAVDEEDDEFSRMSDEELNKRVEEFIWRLKTQIRLQEARDAE